MGDEDKDVASTTVETKPDGTKEATATTKDGSTGSGSNSPGLISNEGDSQAAVKEAADDAKD
jgi:hypothetical protein